VNFLIVMVLLLVVMYVLMIRPQRQRQREQQSMIEGAGVGDDILTTGGIYGTITEADGDDVVVEIADGLSVHMTRRAVAAVLPPEDEEADVSEVVDADAVEELDVDEAPVTASPEAVTSMADGDTTSGDRR
jgi:preprotein translocase subunit YajC